MTDQQEHPDVPAEAALLAMARANDAARQLGTDLPYPDAPATTSDLLEALHQGRPVTVSATIIPEVSRICSYCQGSLDDGESHLHAGVANYPSVSTDRDAWEAAVQAYSAALEQAYQTCKDTDRAAWAVYVAAQEAAEQQYERDRIAAGAAFDQALIGMGRRPVNG